MFACLFFGEQLTTRTLEILCSPSVPCVVYSFRTTSALYIAHSVNRDLSTDVKSWMTANKRQLNDCETEAIIILSNTVQATQTLVCSLVCSRLDYCKSPLSGCPQHLLDHLQKVQNAAARFVPGAKKSDIIHPMHWLPVTHHIQYKRLTICFIYILSLIHI